MVLCIVVYVWQADIMSHPQTSTFVRAQRPAVNACYDFAHVLIVRLTVPLCRKNSWAKCQSWRLPFRLNFALKISIFVRFHWMMTSLFWSCHFETYPRAEVKQWYDIPASLVYPGGLLYTSPLSPNGYWILGCCHKQMQRYLQLYVQMCTYPDDSKPSNILKK